MGGSGTAMTINSHILMSLSRSATSKSSEHEDQSDEEVDPANRVNLAFRNECDNICNLAVNFQMMTEEFRGSDIQLKSTTREKEIKNYLTNTTNNNPSSFRAQ